MTNPQDSEKGAQQVTEERKMQKCDECFERKADVRMRGYDNAQIPLCDECVQQNTGIGSNENQPTEGGESE